MNQEKLWIRELSCGHERLTHIAFMLEDYTKPIIGEPCYCRECNHDVVIIKIIECKDKKLKIELVKDLK